MLSEVLKFLPIDILLQMPMKVLKQICLNEIQKAKGVKLNIKAGVLTAQHKE